MRSGPPADPTTTSPSGANPTAPTSRSHGLGGFVDRWHTAEPFARRNVEHVDRTGPGRGERHLGAVRADREPASVSVDLDRSGDARTRADVVDDDLRPSRCHAAQHGHRPGIPADRQVVDLTAVVGQLERQDVVARGDIEQPHASSRR